MMVAAVKTSIGYFISRIYASVAPPRPVVVGSGGGSVQVVITLWNTAVASSPKNFLAVKSLFS